MDSENRSQEEAIGYWISQESPALAQHLRFQTGYFSINGLSGFSGIIQALVDADRPISAVIGSNDKDTTKGDIERLISLIGCPRKNARATVVSYSNSLFHPKVLHLTRTDGSQLAYVGSANITPAGVTAGNIEAGILLDTNDGDPASILSEIATRIDSWFDSSRVEASMVSTSAEIQKLTDDGILGLVKPKRPSQTNNGGTTRTKHKPSIKPLLSFPAIVSGSTTNSAVNVNTSSGTITPTPSGNLTAGPATTANEILIAEIGGGERWKQANFPISVMQNYFGVNPVANDHIKLHEVNSNGTVGDIVDTKVVNVKSQNYRLELSTVSGIPYPASGRPIGIFRKVAAKEFRYRIVMPADADHSILENYLALKYTGPSRQLKRVIIDSAELQKLWSNCPV